MRNRRCIHEIIKDILEKLESKPRNKTKMIGDGFTNELRKRIWKILIENDFITEIENDTFPKSRKVKKYTITNKGIPFLKDLQELEDSINWNQPLEEKTNV